MSGSVKPGNPKRAGLSRTCFMAQAPTVIRAFLLSLLSLPVLLSPPHFLFTPPPSLNAVTHQTERPHNRPCFLSAVIQNFKIFFVIWSLSGRGTDLHLRPFIRVLSESEWTWGHHSTRTISVFVFRCPFALNGFFCCCCCHDCDEDYYQTLTFNSCVLCCVMFPPRQTNRATHAQCAPRLRCFPRLPWNQSSGRFSLLQTFSCTPAVCLSLHFGKRVMPIMFPNLKLFPLGKRW